MENRKQYFLRGPVKVQLNGLIQGFEEMSSLMKGAALSTAYSVAAVKLRETLTEIIRDDNRAITKINELSVGDRETSTGKNSNSHKNN